MVVTIACVVSLAHGIVAPAADAEFMTSGTTMQSDTGSGHPFGDPTAPISERHVYDFADSLGSAEISTIERDTVRLQRFDLPVLVVTVKGDMSPDQARGIAASVRQDWSIETVDGADDGLVYLVSLPGAEGLRPLVTLSWGDNALPHRGVNSAVVERIQDRWVDRWLDEPHVFEAITYGLRRLIYHTIYDPVPAQPLSGTRESFQTVIGWTALLAVITCLTLVRYVAAGNRRLAGSTLGSMWILDAALFVPVLLLGPASVWAQSKVGVVCTAILLMGAVVVWVRRDPGERHAAIDVPVAQPVTGGDRT